MKPSSSTTNLHTCCFVQTVPNYPVITRYTNQSSSISCLVTFSKTLSCVAYLPMLMNSLLHHTHITISINKLLHLFFFQPEFLLFSKYCSSCKIKLRVHFHCEAFLEVFIHIPPELC